MTLVSLHGQPQASVRPRFRVRIAPEGTCARHSVFWETQSRLLLVPLKFVVNCLCFAQSGCLEGLLGFSGFWGYSNKNKELSATHGPPGARPREPAGGSFSLAHLEALLFRPLRPAPSGGACAWLCVCRVPCAVCSSEGGPELSFL